MTYSIRLVSLGLLLAALSACGGPKNLTCDEVQKYQLAEEGQRVKAPDDLDDLDPLREMVLPEASPREARPPGSECVDRPPGVRLEYEASEE